MLHTPNELDPVFLYSTIAAVILLWFNRRVFIKYGYLEQNFNGSRKKVWLFLSLAVISLVLGFTLLLLVFRHIYIN